MKVLVLLTCFNRKEKTRKGIFSLIHNNPKHTFTFVIADDGSTDGTVEELKIYKKKCNLHIIRGKGNWFYSGGMRHAMEYALRRLPGDYDYVLLMNDDVEFYEGSVERLIEQSQEQNNDIIIGVTCNERGETSYGAIKYLTGYQYRVMELSDWKEKADTFNANCVLLPYIAFKSTGSMDKYYRHTLGDFDYGLSLKRNGYFMHPSKEYIGKCNNNSMRNTWRDTTLKRRIRLKKKESIKGAPTKQWFYFLNKNFGLITAVRGSITPFVRILIGK